jgi:hypothetical protein
VIQCKMRLQESTSKMLEVLPNIKAVGSTYMGVDSTWRVRNQKCMVKMEGIRTSEERASPSGSTPRASDTGTSQQQHLRICLPVRPAQHTKAGIMVAVPQWFRDCLGLLFQGSQKHNACSAHRGGAWQEAFQSCSVNVGYAQVQDILRPVASECRMVHLSTHAMRMCTLELMRVPFSVRFWPASLAIDEIMC